MTTLAEYMIVAGANNRPLMQDKAKESCMVSFRLLHSHLKVLSYNDLNRTLFEGGFEQAFATLFDQDVQTFTCTMLLSLDQLEKQLVKEEFQEIGSFDAFRALMTYSLGNYIAHVVDTDTRPVNDQVLFSEVQLNAKHNVLANEQQHSVQSEPIYDTHLLEKVDSNTTHDSTNMCNRVGEIDQNAEKYQVSCPLLDPSFDNMTTEFSNQSLESENISLKKTVTQLQKDFSRMEAHYANMDLKYQNQSLKDGQHG
ncbi:hypothetical protein Tco_0682475 [Tanacetum coccineum]|uniref:Retrovirus-related Pol polyprotein from transposon TNT 1-94 n=1 Tax=Tanacetum coccineum TaxID=301880 RepID=A0ABQ4XSB8_9ASTR